MPKVLLSVRLGAALAVLFFCGRAFAQGCDQAVIPVDYEHECDGVDVPESYCGGQGTPGYYCYMGYGVCSADGYEFTEANIAPDDSCDPATCCNGGVTCSYRQFCVNDCTCQYASPIIVDIIGKGFHLTSAGDGVMFDISGDGHPIKMAWTAVGSGNAFLALDRNHNGKIDNGKELFGNFTVQPQSDVPNGFLALAEFDKPENGGNGDGIIDKRDAVFSHLLLWIDENHDGISQPNELHSLPELGVFSLGLHYRDDRHFFDHYGNWFHYQAAINPDPRDGESKDGRVTYDVFFGVAGTQPSAFASQSHNQHLRRERWELSLADDLVLASFHASRVGCRPKPQQDNAGVTR